MLSLLERLRVAFGGRRGWHTPDVRSRVVIPTPYLHDETVLRALRALHRDLDYYPTPAGRVLLLQYQPGKPRIEVGRRILQRGLRSGRSNHDAHLLAQGFALFDDMSYSSLYDGSLVARAHRILNVTEAEVEAAHAAALAEADGSAAEARYAALVRDKLESEYRSDHRILFRRAHSVYHKAS